MVEIHRELHLVGGQLLSQFDPAFDARERLLAAPVLPRVCHSAFVESVAVDHQIKRSFCVGCELDGVTSCK